MSRRPMSRGVTKHRLELCGSPEQVNAILGEFLEIIEDWAAEPQREQWAAMLDDFQRRVNEMRVIREHIGREMEGRIARIDWVLRGLHHQRESQLNEQRRSDPEMTATEVLESRRPRSDA